MKPNKTSKGRGRPSKRQQAAARKRKQKRQQADFIFHNRYLVVTRRSNLTHSQKKTVEEMFIILPELRTLRKFADDVYSLFSVRRTRKQAWRIWRRMRRTRKYLNNASLKKSLELLTHQRIEKLLVYLDQPTAHRTKVRTNNHVERCNRKLRYLEKVRYKWRRAKTILRHILLQFQNWIKTNDSPTQTLLLN